MKIWRYNFTLLFARNNNYFLLTNKEQQKNYDPS